MRRSTRGREKGRKREREEEGGEERGKREEGGVEAPSSGREAGFIAFVTQGGKRAGGRAERALPLSQAPLYPQFHF